MGNKPITPDINTLAANIQEIKTFLDKLDDYLYTLNQRVVNLEGKFDDLPREDEEVILDERQLYPFRDSGIKIPNILPRGGGISPVVFSPDDFRDEPQRRRD